MQAELTTRAVSAGYVPRQSSTPIILPLAINDTAHGVAQTIHRASLDGGGVGDVCQHARLLECRGHQSEGWIVVRSIKAVSSSTAQFARYVNQSPSESAK